MTKKKLIGVLIAAALAVGTYFYGSDVVDLVKEQVDALATEVPEVVAPSAETTPGE